MADMIDSVLSALPPGWDQFSYEMELVELGWNDSEYQEIEAKMGNHEITRVVRIENPFLWGIYQLKKEECVRRCSGTTEKDMWHVTDPKFVNSIASNNFDWRLYNRFKFGRGVCFSPNIDHAMRYSTRHGAVILAKVLVGLSCPGHYCTKVPPDNYDTTTGWKKNVYVKYNDNEFYPSYVAYL